MTRHTQSLAAGRLSWGCGQVRDSADPVPCVLELRAAEEQVPSVRWERGGQTFMEMS